MNKSRQITTEKQLAGTQDRVMDGYKRRKAVCTRDDEMALHMFFSPYRVPIGLTNKEVRICIDLYPRKKQVSSVLAQDTEKILRGKLKKALRLNRSARKDIRKVFGSTRTAVTLIPMAMMLSLQQIELPKELMPVGRMTRGRFKTGIAIINRDLDKAA